MPGELDDVGDEALDVVLDVARRLSLKDLTTRVIAAREASTDTSLGVAVLGAFKAGKSSLLNGLIGEELLPVRAVPATSVTTIVHFGEVTTARVHRTSGGTFDVPVTALADYVTEVGNPDNAKGVGLVEVTTPRLADFPDLTLVDTPGLGSVHEAATSVATDWLPKVGVALVVVSAAQPLSEADAELLGRVVLHTPHLLVVLSKVDLLDERDLSEVRRFVEDQVRARTGNAASVVTYSIASGYEEDRAALAVELARMQVHHREAARAVAAHRKCHLVEDAAAYLRLAIAAADADADAVAHLRAALRVEHSMLAAELADARRLLRPRMQRLESRLVEVLLREEPRLRRELLARFGDVATTWRGSLAAEVAQFREWLDGSLAQAVQGRVELVAQIVDRDVAAARESLDLLGDAFLERLDSLVHEALGLRVQLPIAVPPHVPSCRVEAVVSPVFDSHLEMLSWGIPMAFARPLVHRHFAAVAARQVETNLLRLAFRSSATATDVLDSLAEGYVAAMADQLTDCERLVASFDDDAPALRRQLALLESASAALLRTAHSGPPGNMHHG